MEKNGVGLTPLTRGMFGYSLLRPALNQEFFDSIFDQCGKFGIPLEALHTETGMLNSRHCSCGGILMEMMRK